MEKGYTLCYLIELRSKCLSFFLFFPPFFPLLAMFFLKLTRCTVVPPIQEEVACTPQPRQLPRSILACQVPREEGNRAHLGIRASMSFQVNMILISSNLVFLHAPGHRTQEKKKETRQEDIFINACFALLFFRFFFPRKFTWDKEYPIFKPGLLLLKDIQVLILGPKKMLARALSIFLVWNPRAFFKNLCFHLLAFCFSFLTFLHWFQHPQCRGGG